MMCEPADHLLVQRSVAGDRAAFAELVGRHYDLIYRVAFKWCGNQADAEDIAQTVCMKLGQAIRSFDARSAFSSWLYRVTLNAVRDHHRAAKSRQNRDNAATELAETSVDPEPAGQNDALDEIWAAVAELPEKQRDAVLLIYSEGKNHAEAASILNCAESTVSWHVHEAKKRLKGALGVPS
jgi:RNA polymerase sigma-70 factor (ECF subfamily)